LYKEYKNSAYIISIVPFDNDYLHKKWGIKSIFMNNFITYDYNYIIQSKLDNKKIIMLGRGNAIKKRFQKGILAMEYIIKEINNCELGIISGLEYINNLINLVYNLKLENNIHFLGYISYPESYFHNYSLNLFPSISEAFPMVLTETKIYGIPNILLGLDYIKLAKKGNIIIYDDSPESLSREAIKLLKYHNLRQNLGNEARISVKKYNNNLLMSKWSKLILSVYYENNYFQDLIKNDEKMSNNDLKTIINNQIKL
jgi:glycosyltransferase involved in cell wall biosynthesis